MLAVQKSHLTSADVLIDISKKGKQRRKTIDKAKQIVYKMGKRKVGFEYVYLFIVKESESI